MPRADGHFLRFLLCISSYSTIVACNGIKQASFLFFTRFDLGDAHPLAVDREEAGAKINRYTGSSLTHSEVPNDGTRRAGPCSVRQRCWFAGGAAAQEFRATVKGQVVDSSQAALPGATVTVRNQETGEVGTATTNNEGNYTVPFLRPGVYSVTVEMTASRSTPAPTCGSK